MRDRLKHIFRAAGNLTAIVLLIWTVLFSASAAATPFIPVEPDTIAKFEEVWDRAAADGSEEIEIHFEERQSSNTYHKYKNMIQQVAKKYRYVHPEDFNYLRLKDYTITEDEGTNTGFSMTFVFEDLNESVKREYSVIAAQKARELYESVTDGLAPTLSQRERAKLLCLAVCRAVEYKDDGTDLCHTAYSALVNGYAVCDGYTSLLNLLLRMDGIECEGQLGSTRSAVGTGSHEWTRAKLDGEWVNIDATWADGGKPEYIAMTDLEIAATHTADLSYDRLRGKEQPESSSGAVTIQRRYYLDSQNSAAN